MILAKRWCAVSNSHYKNSNSINSTMDLNRVFPTHSGEEEIYPLTVSETAEEQTKDKGLQQQRHTSKFEETLIENTYVICKNGKMIIPKTFQKRAAAWYHHYLQHPGHSYLEETLKAAMYWKNLQTDVQYHVKTCKSCQVNKCKKLKYSKLPPKLVVDTPWECLCVNLIGPYTLRGKDGSEIDFMCLTMIDPATSWFKMVELPVTDDVSPTGTVQNKCPEQNISTRTKEACFDKSSIMISNLVKKCWFSRYPGCQNIIYDNGSEFKLHFKTLCIV